METEPNVSNTAIPFFLDPRGPEEYAQGRRLSQSRRASLTRPRPVIGGPAASPLLSTPVPPTQEGEDGLNGTPKLTSEQLAGMLPPRRYALLLSDHECWCSGTFHQKKFAIYFVGYRFRWILLHMGQTVRVGSIVRYLCGFPTPVSHSCTATMGVLV